jgi:hypothetical protein
MRVRLPLAMARPPSAAPALPVRACTCFGHEHTRLSKVYTFTAGKKDFLFCKQHLLSNITCKYLVGSHTHKYHQTDSRLVWCTKPLLSHSKRIESTAPHTSSSLRRRQRARALHHVNCLCFRLLQVRQKQRVHVCLYVKQECRGVA